jgi:bacillithiol biosynthesis cysteine-adding enzyme BshC
VNLLHDYEAGRKDLLEFYAVPPEDFLRTPDFSPACPPALRHALNVFQKKIGASGEMPPESYVVATGQQPGILTGPLYTILKAISAIQHAEAFERATGKPCVPVFWVASDDHDFEEVRSVHLLTREHEPLTLRYDPDIPHTGCSMHSMPLSPTLHQLVDAAANAAKNSEQTPAVAEFLHESLEASSSVSEWFARILARLFAGTRMLIFDPDLREARSLAAPIFARELAEPLATTRAINAAGKRLDAIGYTPPIRKQETECSFFLHAAKRRCKVLYEDEKFMQPEASVALSMKEMRNLLEASPEKFSANVALRPIAQQALFPVVAYIGGPAEVAYWGQFKEVFARHHLPMPAVLPRAQAAVSTLKLKKLMTKLGLSFDDLDKSPALLLESVLRRAATPALQVFEHRKGELSAAVQSLAEAIEAASAQYPEAHHAARQFERHVAAGLRHLEGALLRSDKARTETARTQLHRVLNELYPHRMPQERYYCIFSWLFEYGWELIPRLLAEIDTRKSGVQEITL